MSGQVYTSTPKKEEEETSALREHKWQKIIEKTNIDGRRKKLSSSKKRFVATEKENFRHFKNSNQKKFSSRDIAAEKRRNQAIESMKLAEQRRKRKMSENAENNIAEEFSKINLGCENDLLPDGRIKLTKKQIIARDLKQNRIKKYYYNQQARKHKAVHFRDPVVTSEHVVPVQVHQKQNEDDNVPEAAKVDQGAVKDEGKSVEMTCQNLIRYSKEELREMCPYGIYFLR